MSEVSTSSPEGGASEALFVVDGFNFTHAVVLRKDERPRFVASEERARLVDLFSDLPLRGVLVIDDRSASFPREQELSEALSVERPKSGFHLLTSPDADATILDCVAASSDPARLCVVTADRSLADRSRHRGARVLSPFRFAETFFGGPPRELRSALERAP